MSYTVGNYYGSFKIRTKQDGTKEVYDIMVEKLKADLCMGGYVWEKPVFFKTTQEAHDYIRKMMPDKEFEWKISFGTRCRTVYKEDKGCDWLTPAWECATYQTIKGTDYLVDVCER